MGAVLILFLPLYVAGQEYQSFIALKIGTYNPTGDLDDSGFDSGTGGEFVWGIYYFENFSTEFGVGYFASDLSISSIVSGFGQVEQKADVAALPFFLSLKGHIPFVVGEIYGGAGIDFIIAGVDFTIKTPLGTASFTDANYIFGGHIMVGLNFNITERLFIGVEGKYLVTTDASFSDTNRGLIWTADINFTGYSLFGQVGYRW